MTRCQSCDGIGHTTAFVTRSRGCDLERVQCYTCHGTGTDPRDPEAVRVGEAARQARISAGLSLREEAKRRGISVVALSDFEHGRPCLPWDCSEEVAG